MQQSPKHLEHLSPVGVHSVLMFLFIYNNAWYFLIVIIKTRLAEVGGVEVGCSKQRGGGGVNRGVEVG